MSQPIDIEAELLPGCLLLRSRPFIDARGSFVKTFHEGLFDGLGIHFRAREQFYSVSQQGVLRGMHFQRPPHDHAKLVACRRGQVLDVLLDLRPGPGFGRSASVVLSADAHQQLFMPQGIAHGFLALTDHATMDYQTSTVHAPTHDAGIRWNSFGFDWGVAEPIVSARDAAHPGLHDGPGPFADGTSQGGPA